MISKKSLFLILVVPSLLVLIPAGAMFLQAEGWAWSVSDFVLAWVLIASAMLTYTLVASRFAPRAYRMGVALAVATGLVLLWINGAVGIIGSEDNPANVLYAGVLLVAAAGSWIARLRPVGMSRALFATAFAQFLVPVIALIVWRPDFSPGVVQVFILNFVFVLLFAGAGELFRISGREMKGPCQADAATQA